MRANTQRNPAKRNPAVARHAADKDVIRSAKEAVKATQDTADAYRRVAGQNWLLNILIERGELRQAVALAQELLPQALALSHSVNRVDALWYLWRATKSLPASIQQSYRDALVTACLAAASWKGGYRLYDVVQIVAQQDCKQAYHIAAQMPESIYRRKAMRHLTLRCGYDPTSSA